MIGTVVESAEAIQASLAPGTIWVSEATHRLVAPLFTWEAYDDTGHQPLAHRPQVDKGRGIEGLSSPLVGRDAELRTLQKTVERLRAGIGGIVTLVGEAGIGKSRLVAELRRNAGVPPASILPARNTDSLTAGHAGETPAIPVWIEGRCFSYATGSAYQVWRDMLRVWLDAPAGAAPKAVVTTLRERVRAVCPNALNDIYPFLAWLLSLPLDTTATTRLRGIDAEGLQVLTFRAVATLLETAAPQTPLVLVCEDLHWADATSLALLEHLLALTDRVPLLFVCIFRPEREYGCWHIREVAARTYEHHHTDIRLRALSLAESAQLVGNLLTIEALPKEFRTRVLERAEGNPFYVEEIVRALIDDAIIVYNDEAEQWHVTQELEDFTLPDTLYGVLMARIDRLPVGAKRVLQLASVVGRTVSHPLLAAIAEHSTLDAHLVTLQRAGMMRARARSGEREFIFHHQFTLEAAYGSLLRRRRRILHKRVAEALERLYPEHIEENLGLLAHHWEQAEDTEQALVYLRRAGEQAAARYANAEALAYFSRTLDLLPPDRLEERLTILLTREDIHHLQGMRDAQQRDLQALQDVVAALDNQSAQVIVALRRARYAKRTGAWALCDSLLQETLPLIEGTQDVQGKARSYLEWGKLQMNHLTSRASLEKAIQLAHTSGLKAIEAESWRELGHEGENPEQAALYYERGLQLSREIGNRKLEGTICNALAAVLSGMDNDTEAQPYLELGIRLCRETGNRFDEGWGVFQLAGLCYHQGDYAAALHYAQQALFLAGEVQSPALEFCALEYITQVFKDLGQHAEAVTYCEHVLHDARETGNPVMVCWALFYMGLHAHYLGDDARALTLGQEILHTGQALGEERVQQWAWMLVGHALTGLDRLDDAGAAYQRSLSQLESPSRWTLCRWAGLARIALLKGRTETLQAALPQVEEILRYWEAHPALRDVTFDRFEICWTCYRLLQALQDPRAPEVLERAYNLVQATVAKLQDPEHRRMFMEDVAVHQEIVAEFEKTHNSHNS